MSDDKVTATYKHAEQGDTSPQPAQRDVKDWRDGLLYFIRCSNEDAINRIREHAPSVVGILRAVYDYTECGAAIRMRPQRQSG